MMLLPIFDQPWIWYMKTTLDIPDPLLREARKIAARERTTLRALVEQGLRKVIAERKATRPFRLRDASFGGRGWLKNCATPIGAQYAI
jgi:predicted nucleic acid-binding protein